MTLDRDSQLKSLVDDITTLLATDLGAADDSLPENQSPVSRQTKEVLGRAQTALSELMGNSPSGASETSSGSDANAAVPQATTDVTDGGQPSVVRSVEQEIQKLREDTLSPLKSDLDGLRQQQKTLATEVAQLEQQRQYYQSLAQQQSNQAQLVDDLVQPLRDRLETAVTEQVGKLLEEFRQGSNDGDASTTGNRGLNTDQINRVQEQSNEVLEQLQDTLQTVFSALQANTQRYESTIQSSLERIQTLGEQSEAILEHWLGRLASTGESTQPTGVPQSQFAAGVGTDLSEAHLSENLSETDPALAGVPYPGMDLPMTAGEVVDGQDGGEGAEEGEEREENDAAIAQSSRGLATAAMTAMATPPLGDITADFDDADNPFALGDLDLTDLSYRPPAIAAPEESPLGVKGSDIDGGEGDIDFEQMDDVEADATVIDGTDGLLAELDSEGTAIETAVGEAESADLEEVSAPVESDPQAELPLVGLDLETEAPELEEEEDEDATVIQYVNLDMLKQRREETFQMPDVLVTLSDDEGSQVSEDLGADGQTEVPDWQEGEDDAAQYLSEDLSNLETAEPEGIAEVPGVEEPVDLGATPMAEDGVIPSDGGDVWDEAVDEGGEAIPEAVEAVASFAAITSDADAGTNDTNADPEALFPVTPSASSPEEAVVEETSALGGNPAALELALDEELSGVEIDAQIDDDAQIDIDDLDLDTDGEGAESDGGEGDRDELLMTDMMAIGAADAQVEAAIAGDAGDDLDDFLALEADGETADLADLSVEQAGDDGEGDDALALTELDDVMSDLSVDESPSEVEMVDDLPAVEALMETEGTNLDDDLGTRSLEGDDPGISVEEDAELGASALDQVGLPAEVADPFAGLDDADGLDDLDVELDDGAITRSLGTEEVADETAGDTEGNDAGAVAIGLGAAAAGFAAFASGDASEPEDISVEELSGTDAEDSSLELTPDLGGDLELEEGLTVELGDEETDAETIEASDGLADSLDDLGVGDSTEPDVGLDESLGLSEDLGLELGESEVSEEMPEVSLELDTDDGALDLDLGTDTDATDALDLGALDSLPEEAELSVLEDDAEGSADDLALELPETLPESVEDGVADLLDEAVAAADALELPELELSDTAESVVTEEVSEDAEALEAGALIDEVPVDLELEAVLGDGGEAEASEAGEDTGLGIDLDGETLDGDLLGELGAEMGTVGQVSSESEGVDLGDLGDLGDGLGDTVESSSSAMDPSAIASDIASDGDDLGFDLDLEGLGTEDPIEAESIEGMEGENTELASEGLTGVINGSDGTEGDGDLAELGSVDPASSGSEGEDLGLDLDLDGLGMEEPVGGAGGDDLGLELDGVGEGDSSEASVGGDSLDLDLDLEGLGEGDSGAEGLDFDLGDLDTALGDVAAPTAEAVSETGLDELDLGLEALGDEGMDLGDELTDDLGLGLVETGAEEAGDETIASLDEALDLGDVTAVTNPVESAPVAESGDGDGADFDLEMLDSLADFSEESSPLADVDADLDAFLADALGSDADGVEKKKD